MNHSSKKFRTIQKLTALVVLTNSMQISAITSNMTHRVMGTSPLLYKMMDYSKHQTCFEVEPIFSSMYDAPHVNSNIILSGKSSLIFDQQGAGDLNPTWLNLMANNTSANYYSTVTFTPKLTQSGALFHAYDQFDNNIFFDAKTALVQCKSEVAINEVGGDNGLNTGIANAQQAFTQSDWNYGKIGQANHVVGLDNIELRLGRVAHCTSEFSSYDMLIAGFAILEAPTGTGTKAEWLFEPQVGTNHWGVGLGFEALVSGDDDLKFMIAGNYRYLTPAWETRSFDLLGNGQWSRYLSVQNTYGLPTAPASLGLPGINYFTQQAYINGRSELNLYTRLQKQFQNFSFEVAYNFFCIQRETIGAIKSVPSGFGIYSLTGPAGGAGGVTTSSTATINQDVTTLDTLGSPISVTTDNFDKLSAAAAAYATNTLTARLEIHNNNIIYGFGASIETAQSASAISTWSVWAQFGFLFDNIVSCPDHHEFSPELYDFNTQTSQIIYHAIDMDEAQLPKDVITSLEDDFIEDNNFEFLESDIFENDNLEDDGLDNDDLDVDKDQLNLQIQQLNAMLAQSYDSSEQSDNEMNMDDEHQDVIPADFMPEEEPSDMDAMPMNTDTMQDQTIAMPLDEAVDNVEQPAMYEEPVDNEEQTAMDENFMHEDDNNQDFLPDDFMPEEEPFDMNAMQESDMDAMQEPEEADQAPEEIAYEDDNSMLIDNADVINAENHTIALDDHAIIPVTENGLKLLDDNQTDENIENPLENEIDFTDEQNEDGKENLIADFHPAIKMHATQPMSDEDIALFNFHAKNSSPAPVNENTTIAISEMDILDKLDSTK